MGNWYSYSFIVQLPSHVWLFVTPWTAARQVSLSLPISRSLPDLLTVLFIYFYNFALSS